MSDSNKTIFTGYLPRVHQEYLHANLKRWSVLVCHRRFGKTVFALNEKIDKALRNPLKKPQYAYIAPTYAQAKRIAWEMLKEFTKKFPGVETNESDLRVDIPRPYANDFARIWLLSAEKPDNIRGLYLDGNTFDEYSECDPTIWSQVVRPALADRLGWCTFIGTPKGQNHFYDTYMRAKESPNSFHAMFKASETGIISTEELADARSQMTQEEYDQEFECSFSAAMMGAYYGQEMEQAEEKGRICSVPYDKNALVSTFWDLGMDDSLAIWFLQEVGREIHVIDYIENNGESLGWYAEKLRQKGYKYYEHWLPHDVKVRDLSGIDGKTRKATLEELGVYPIRVAQKMPPEERIHAGRGLIDKAWFDRKNCGEHPELRYNGIGSLKNYQRAWNAKNRTYSTKPLHNWATHGADAWGLAGMHFESPGKRTAYENFPKYAKTDYDIFNYRSNLRNDRRRRR